MIEVSSNNFNYEPTSDEHKSDTEAEISKNEDGAGFDLGGADRYTYILDSRPHDYCYLAKTSVMIKWQQWQNVISDTKVLAKHVSNNSCTAGQWW